MVGAGTFEVLVDDDGPGLTGPDRTKAVKRGRRLDETKPRSGLGLSIVADLAHLYKVRFDLDSPRRKVACARGFSCRRLKSHLPRLEITLLSFVCDNSTQSASSLGASCVVRSGRKSMRVAFWRAASLVTLALVPVLVAACGPDKGAGFLLGAFSTPAGSEPAGNARVRVSTPGNGVVIGGISSDEIGQQMSTRERGIAADAEYRALEYGRSGAAVAWTYPAMSHRGLIVPGRPYKKGDQYCRTYTHTINRGGSPEIVKGVACREDNGTWRGIS